MEDQDFKIVRLSKENFEEAIRLANSVFPHDTKGKHSPSNVFHSILEPEKYKEYRKQRKILETFVALGESGKVIGVTGFYRRNWDKRGTIWLGWFCVDPKERGKGYGKMILLWTIEKLKQDGFEILKLWTTSDPNEATAQKLYDKVGLRITSKGRRRGVEFKVIYRTKML